MGFGEKWICYVKRKLGSGRSTLVLEHFLVDVGLGLNSVIAHY
uniref:Uncharacterized protein n=1 Tax=Arundo donax TaxID=35708 RepID=A0A0A9AN05_ARUDO